MSDYVDKRSDKKMIYLLLAIIAVLLIVAIAVIVYLASRMTSMQQASPVTKQPVARQARSLEPTPTPKSQPQPQPQPKPEPEPTPKAPPAPPAREESKRPARLATEDIATIVQMVMTQMQKNQKPAAAPQPAAKPQPATPPQPTVQPEPFQPSEPETPVSQSSSDDLESVLDVLENVDVDTVEEQTDNLSASTTRSMASTHAKKGPKRANDNFNKVVVSDSTGDDLSQLGIEIDQLENDTNTPESGYEKVMKKEVVERQNEMRTIVVSEGDTLMSIAKKAYGDPRKYIRILQANPGIIKNPDRIFVGQVLRVPQ